MANVYYKFGIRYDGAYWTETYKFDGGAANPDTNLPMAKALATARAALLLEEGASKQISPEIVSVTIGNLAVKRQVATFPLSYFGTMKSVAEDSLNRASAQIALKIVLYSEGKVKRAVLRLPGLPLFAVNTSMDARISGRYAGVLSGALNPFLAAILPNRPGKPAAIKGTLLIQHKEWAATPVRRITELGWNLLDQWLLTIPAHGLPLNRPVRVRIRGVRSPTSCGLNGEAWATPNDANHVVLNKVVARKCDTTIRRYGVLEVLTNKKAFTAVSEGFAIGWALRTQGGVGYIGPARNKQCCG